MNDEQRQTWLQAGYVPKDPKLTRRLRSQYMSEEELRAAEYEDLVDAINETEEGR